MLHTGPDINYIAFFKEKNNKKKDKKRQSTCLLALHIYHFIHIEYPHCRISYNYE